MKLKKTWKLVALLYYKKSRVDIIILNNDILKYIILYIKIMVF